MCQNVKMELTAVRKVCNIILFAILSHETGMLVVIVTSTHI